MPIRTVPDTDVKYCLIVFDEHGQERREPDGSLMSDTVRTRLATATTPVTDVLFTSHGWKGDVPAAIEQYDAWIGAMEQVEADRVMARQRRPRFNPLIVGLHWPSLPWGDESVPATAGGAVLSADGGQASIDALVEEYAARIADSPRARAAIRTILEASRRDPTATTLPAPVKAAYDVVFDESGLPSGDRSARPGADQEGFDPAAIIADARRAPSESSAAPGAPGVLGIGDTLRDALAMPLRQLSFWKMKDRARSFGETGGHDLLISLQRAAPSARFHLMGHSFGCIVVSATVAGPPDGETLPRPVDSLFLVQGALSLWSYAADIPYAPGTAGYFYRTIKQGLVRGPIVTTRSTKDAAVGRFYPLGARIRKQLVLADTKFPQYGGIGSFGMQATGIDAQDMPMQSATFAYDFRGGRVYNLESSQIIRNGGGASGAHSDIAHPEVAHAFWCAVLSGARPPVTRSAQRRGAGGGRGGSPGVLGAEPPAAPLPPRSTRATRGQRAKPPAVDGPRESQAPVASETAPPPQRYINAKIEDQPPDAPLVTGRSYTLAFDVDLAQRDTALGSIALDERNIVRPDDPDEVQLTVQLDSTDFDISDRTRPLRLPRTGRSRGKARFDITPKHDGASSVKATIHRDGNFIQQMELTFQVGAQRATPVEISARARPASAASIVQPRDVGLSMSPAPAGGYDCVVWGSVSARARLPIQQGYLASAIDAARHELMKVVMHQDAAGDYVFQTSIDIPHADRDAALRTMARAGSLLLQKIFFGPGAGADSKAVGEWLKKMAADRTTRLKIQIVAESTPVPWGLLYVGDASANATLDWDNFLGMRHVIEQIPLQNTLTVSDCAIPSDQPELVVSVNVNSGIDAQMGSDLVARQQTYWADAQTHRRHLRVTPRSTSAEVRDALASGTTDDQILYFYCHAESAGLTDAGGPDASCIVMTDDRLTLGDLSLDAPTSTSLRGSPLVFINACESAELSPSFYDGFVPYFMAKGARGVVGTECKTPALFAVAWAERFFERFLGGDSLGELFLDLRREFLAKHGNPLGLMYAVHCDGDTQIRPALIEHT